MGASPDLDVASVTYDYDGAVAYGSDHALVAADVIFTGTHQPADGHGGRGWPPSADGGSTDRLPGDASTSGPTGLCIGSVVKAGSGLKSLLRRLGGEILEVRQRQRWRSEGIGIQRLWVDPAVSALDEASGLMKPEPEVRTSFHPDRRSPDDSRISGLRHARTAVFLESCLGRP